MLTNPGIASTPNPGVGLRSRSTSRGRGHVRRRLGRNIIQVPISGGPFCNTSKYLLRRYDWTLQTHPPQSHLLRLGTTGGRTGFCNTTRGFAENLLPNPRRSDQPISPGVRGSRPGHANAKREAPKSTVGIRSNKPDSWDEFKNVWELSIVLWMYHGIMGVNVGLPVTNDDGS